MVALNQLPISFCSSAGFHYFMSIVEPNYKAIKEEALKKRLYALKTDIKEKVKEKLRSAQSVSCTSDCWSSLSQQSYITIGAHIIDTQWCPISFTLTTHELHERHTAENLTQQLENTFNEWEIDKKVVAVVTDNAKNIVNAVTSLSYIPEVCSSTCAAHSLQLCINNSLKTDTITEIIQKCSKLVGHFKHSNVAMNELHKKQEQLGYPKSSLLQYCKTRWNSIYTMLDRLFINRSVILSVLTDRSITTSDICRKLEITENQWCLIETLICLLKPFYVLTTVLCKENHSPVSMVRPLLHKVIENHLKSQDDDNIIIKDFRKTVVNELTKRFNLQFEITNIISVSHISSFLDPRYKDLEHEPIHVREEIRNHVKNVLNNIVVHQQQPQQHTSIGNSDLKFLYCHDSLPENEISDQFQGYLAETQLRFDFDPFEWWKTREHKYPVIAKLALKYLTIPATSVSSERCFSTAGNIVTSKRSCLLSENVNMLIFLYQNRKLLE